MKKILCLFALVVFSCGIVCGQMLNASPNRSPEYEASRQTGKMQAALRLSKDQIQKVYDINLFYERERQLKGNKDAASRARKKDASLKKVLSPEQYRKLQQMRKSEPKQRDTSF